MKDKLQQFINWYFSRKAAPYWTVLLVDTSLVFFSELVCYYLVNGLTDGVAPFAVVLGSCAMMLPGFIIGFRIFHTYSGIIRYSTSTDLMRLAGAMVVGTIIAFGIHRFAIENPHLLYAFRAIILLFSAILSILLCITLRIVIKFSYDHLINCELRKPAFVYGVQSGGEMLGHSIMNDKDSPYVLSGFITDDPSMCHHRMMGVKVYLLDENLIDILVSKHIRAVFVSPLRSEALRNNTEFVNSLIGHGIKVMMQPSELEWDGVSTIGTSQLHEVEIEDLLPREKIEVDLEAIGRLLEGKVVMVTGAAGSIGYEMSRQIAKFKPSRLVLIDQAETPTHTVRLHMAKHYPDMPCETIVSSIANQTKMESIFAAYKPDYVFHAAAYKHVPMMEDNPSEAVQNNIYGTRVIADLAVKYGTKKFVMISTDKAVNPTNVMGCSKRICEIYCQALNKALKDMHDGADLQMSDDIRKHLLQIDGTPGITHFVTTRFGNVLGSNGSVIPLFRKQIKQGGPVTVTHPDIIRFFMLIPEACRLVLEAGTMGHGGEIFVFDMGKPVRIADLAQRMIVLSGAKNVEIKYTGLRDGEKLYEEVLNDAEQTRPTPHPKIMVAAVREYSYEDALRNEEELYKISYTYDDMKVVAKMKEIVPEYKSKHSKYEVLDKD